MEPGPSNALICREYLRAGDTELVTIASVISWLRRMRWAALVLAFASAIALDLLAGVHWAAALLVPVAAIAVCWLPAIETIVTNFRRGYESE